MGKSRIRWKKINIWIRGHPETFGTDKSIKTLQIPLCVISNPVSSKYGDPSKCEQNPKEALSQDPGNCKNVQERSGTKR